VAFQRKESGRMRAFVIVLTLVVVIGISVYLVAAMFRSMKAERGVRKKWKNFGLSIAFCVLFFISWIAHGFVQWEDYSEQQKEHKEQPTIAGFVVSFGESTLENWQSEFLQLFSFVVLSALLIHKGSAESKDSDDEMLERIKRIEKHLGVEK
jgi:heme/copper-type cytochrome/quinol oxidase subunit 2